MGAPDPPKDDPNYKWPKALFALERVHADLAGPVFGFSWLVLIDSYSKYPFVYQLTSTTSGILIEALKEIFSYFGIFKCLVTDNGPQFVSQEFSNFLESKGIKHIKTPTYHPSSNGAAERLVRTFKETMAKLIKEGYSAKESKQIFLEEYRGSPHPSTGKAPRHYS